MPTLSMVRWGILGLGNIARQFAKDLPRVSDSRLVAVGSRTQATADAFGAEFGAPHRYASYAEVARDPDVDAIYIATPHTLHHENALLCLNAGKAVLVEKPFAVNASQARAVVATARARGLFAMEAVWTRFLPIIVRLREMIAEGAIGEVRMVQADFGFRTSFNPTHRLFDPALGGGALLDVGIYPVSLASMLLGTPSNIVGLAHLGQTGVDEQAGMVLSYPGGGLAVLSTAIRTTTPQEALIFGTEGYIRIHSPWWHSTRLTLSRPQQEDEVMEAPLQGIGYQYEAAEVVRCLQAGRMESDVMPLDETVAVMTTLDELRRQWGLRYPTEDEGRRTEE
ncbi:MAG: Gfo/Idh/MocA family oxidoreductase [Anaerolineae bacterium]|nr:Gfo/Idh/MocA family oxidoreductase [Anaerolineae bacterium]